MKVLYVLPFAILINNKLSSWLNEKHVAEIKRREISQTELQPKMWTDGINEFRLPRPVRINILFLYKIFQHCNS